MGSKFTWPLDETSPKNLNLNFGEKKKRNEISFQFIRLQFQMFFLCSKWLFYYFVNKRCKSYFYACSHFLLFSSAKVIKLAFLFAMRKEKEMEKKILNSKKYFSFRKPKTKIALWSISSRIVRIVILIVSNFLF